MVVKTLNSTAQESYEISSPIYYCNRALDEGFLVAYAILGLAMLVGNAFTCAVFLITPQLRYYNMNIFLVSFGVADILTALFVIPGHCAFCVNCSKDFFTNILDKQTCRFLDGVKDYVWLGSVLSLLGITYDRYLAVIQPLRYHSKMTANKVVYILLVVWLLPAPVSFVKPIFQVVNVDLLEEGSRSESVFDVVVVLSLIIAPMAAIFIVNVMITRAIKKQRGKVNRDTRIRRSVGNFKRNSENRGKTISCLIVALIFLVSWFPRVLLNVMFVLKIHHTAGLKLLEKISFVFLFLQSSINPFLYSFYRKDFRQAAKNLLKYIAPNRLSFLRLCRVRNRNAVCGIHLAAAPQTQH